MKETDVSKLGWGFVKETQNDTRARKYRKRAKENFRFYTGSQWDPKDIRKLKAQSRPALTINSILSTVNLVSGYQRQNRRDIKVYPRRGGTEKVSRALTELSKHAMDTTNGNYMKSMSFLDGAIGGKGWISLDLDYNVDPINGDIKVERLSPFMVDEDPSADTYDLNQSAKYIIRSQWKTARQIGLIYPDKKKEFENNIDMFHKEINTYGSEVMTVETDSYQEAEEEMAPYHSQGQSADKKYKYKVRTIFWRQDERVKYLVDVKTLTAVPIDKTKAKTISDMINGKNAMFAGQSQDDFKTIDRVVP
ncbi:MAG: hypothetical protein U9R36_04885, partial [Elusimicrobiota bacterium]|nr:hypothetical protein [Elusimicrobiota bacterium]